MTTASLVAEKVLILSNLSRPGPALPALPDLSSGGGAAGLHSLQPSIK